MQPITRSFAPVGATYEKIKPSTPRSRSEMLRAGIEKYPRLADVIDQIKTPNNKDPLFISKNKWFGPDIPKSAQKLLAAAFIGEVGWAAFTADNTFDFDFFEKYLTRKGHQCIVSELKKSYFKNISLDAHYKFHLAATDSDYHVSSSFLPHAELQSIVTNGVEAVRLYCLGHFGYDHIHFIQTLSWGMASYGKCQRDNQSAKILFQKPAHMLPYLMTVPKKERTESEWRSYRIIESTNDYNLTKDFRTIRNRESFGSDELRILHIDARQRVSRDKCEFDGAKVSLNLSITDNGTRDDRISSEDAELIFKEIESLQYNVLIVNCHMGISRSAATNYALAYIFGGMTLENIIGNITKQQVELTGENIDKRIQCNPLVFNSLVVAANKRYGLRLPLIRRGEYGTFRQGLAFAEIDMFDEESAPPRVWQGACRPPDIGEGLGV